MRGRVALQDEERVFSQVLGVSIADPEILKATQWVLTSVIITSLFLGSQLLREIEDQVQEVSFGNVSEISWWQEMEEQVKAVSFSNSEMLWWAIDGCVQITLLLSGYIGIKRSSPPQLALLWLLSLVLCSESVLEAANGLLTRETPKLIAIEVCDAIFYAIGVHYGRYLWKEAAGRASLHSLEAPPLRSSYNMLGIPIVNLRVLSTAHWLFTSLGVMWCILGLIMVGHPEVARPDIWPILLLLVIVCAMGYFGVRWSSVHLLAFFTFIMLVLLFELLCIGFGLVITFVLDQNNAPPACLSLVWFVFGLFQVLLVGLSSAFTLTAGLLTEEESGGLTSSISRAGDDQAPLPVIVGAPALRSTADASGPRGDIVTIVAAAAAAAPPPKSAFEDVD